MNDGISRTSVLERNLQPRSLKGTKITSFVVPRAVRLCGNFRRVVSWSRNRAEGLIMKAQSAESHKGKTIRTGRFAPSDAA